MVHLSFPRRGEVRVATNPGELGPDGRFLKGKDLESGETARRRQSFSAAIAAYLNPYLVGLQRTTD